MPNPNKTVLNCNLYRVLLSNENMSPNNLLSFFKN